MFFEQLVQSIAFLIAVLVLGFFAVVILIIVLLRIKQKLIDWFGSELKNSNVNVRKAYVMKLNDEEVLKKVALSEYNEDIGVEAVERINNKSSLEEIAKCNKFRVSRAAKRRLNEL